VGTGPRVIAHRAAPAMGAGAKEGLGGGGLEGDLVIAVDFHASGDAALNGVSMRASPGQKLHPNGDDLMLAARVALRVLPGAVLQPAFDERWGAFLQILAAGLGLVTEDHDVERQGSSRHWPSWPLTRVLTGNPRVATGVPLGL